MVKDVKNGKEIRGVTKLSTHTNQQTVPKNCKPNTFTAINSLQINGGNISDVVSKFG